MSGFLDAETLLGVRVVEAGTPALTGRELASQMGAELTNDPVSTAEALSRRVEAGLTPPLVLPPDEFEALREDATHARRLLERAKVDDKTRSELVSLGDELARADRIRLRTESALTESLSRRLSASTGLSVHPDSLRAAAAAVAEARARVGLASKELDDLGPPPETTTLPPATAPSLADAPVEPPEPDDDRSEPLLAVGSTPVVLDDRQAFNDPSWADAGPRLLSHEAPERKKPPTWVLGAALGLVALFLVLVLAGVMPVGVFFALLVLVLAPIQAGWFFLYRRYVAEELESAALAESDGGRATTAMADPFGGGPADPGTLGSLDEEPDSWGDAPDFYNDQRLTTASVELTTAEVTANGTDAGSWQLPEDSGLHAWHDRLAGLSVSVDHAEDILRGALARWEALAGPGAHPDDVETVIQAKDPQFQFASLAAQESATMRTANAFHRRAMAKWRVAWAMLGYDEPPTPEQVQDELTPATRKQLDDAQATVERAEAAERWAAAGALIDQPLVVADVQGWFPTDQVSELIHSLPAGVHVVVVRPTRNGDGSSA